MKPNLNGELDKDGKRIWTNSKGELHRENGPAVEWVDGDKLWYINGKLHREDGPAIELADGTKYWYINGEQHREDGPAVEDADGNMCWFINDKQISKDEWLQWLKDGHSSLTKNEVMRLILEWS
jgi:hypothetical protein